MPEHDELGPEEQEVRRLLADARHTEPIPDEVSARLDAVLADLRANEPPASSTGAPDGTVTDLAAARRRRTARSILVAAAAVVAIGVGISQIPHLGSGDSDDSAGSSADNSLSNGSQSEQDSAGGANAQPPDLAPSDHPPRLDPDRFGDQVARLQRTYGSDERLPAPGTAAKQFAEGRSDAMAASCSADRWGHGRALPVRYDHQAGVLIFRDARGDTQVVDLFLCGRDDPVRSITLPAP
jgi:hypothetical protein